MLRTILLCLLGLLPFGGPVFAQTPPAEIKIGHLHASSGAFASISMPVYTALKLWVDQTNASGGALVKAYNKKIPLKLISYDDQSSTATAATLYDQLITQDKVDMLVADSGSVLTSVAVPIAKEHNVLLFNPTGTGAAFFQDNPWIVLIADPVSTIWPKYVADFLNEDGVKAGIKRVAILYSTNDFTGTQATAVRNFIKSAGKLDIVYDQGVPTNTSNYTVLLNNIGAANPDAVLELGYVGNDIAFLRNLQDSGQKFRFLFAIYPGLETATLLKNVGADGIKGAFTYVTSADYEYKPEVGMTLAQLKETWEKTVGPNGGVEFGFNSIAGYTTGLVLQETLSHADSLDQASLRKAVFSLSGKLKTVDGPFEIDERGAQIGEITPLGQVEPDGKGGVTLKVVYPHPLANGTAMLDGK
ncbi:MAG: amino acid ABC transporter substrate-binding protein [Beijerinckiaceae bacterium]